MDLLAKKPTGVSSWGGGIESEVVSVQLLEYRPGRYCWLDDEGRVIRKATAEEVSAEIGRQSAGGQAPESGLEGLPLFTAATEATISGRGRRKPARKTQPHEARPGPAEGPPAATAPPAKGGARPKPTPAPTAVEKPPQAKAPAAAPAAPAKARARPKPTPAPAAKTEAPQAETPPVETRAATPAAPAKGRAGTKPTPAPATKREAPQGGTTPAIPARDKARPKPTPAPAPRGKPPEAASPRAEAEAPEPAVADLQAGDLVCSNCGEPWPGTFSGFWRQADGQWLHWCHGGQPGTWRPAVPVDKN